MIEPTCDPPDEPCLACQELAAALSANTLARVRTREAGRAVDIAHHLDTPASLTKEDGMRLKNLLSPPHPAVPCSPDCTTVEGKPHMITSQTYSFTREPEPPNPDLEKPEVAPDAKPFVIPEVPPTYPRVGEMVHEAQSTGKCQPALCIARLPGDKRPGWEVTLRHPSIRVLSVYVPESKPKVLRWDGSPIAHENEMGPDGYPRTSTYHRILECGHGF